MKTNYKCQNTHEAILELMMNIMFGFGHNDVRLLSMKIA